MSIPIVVIMYAVWSSVFSLGKMTLQYCPPLFLTGARMLMAGLLLLGFLAIFKRSSFKLNRLQILSIVLLALFSIYLSNALEFWGLQYLSAAKTCFIYSLSPFFAALFSYLHFNEKMNGRKWLGLGIGFLGFIPVLLTQTGSEELLNAFSFFSWPTLAIMGAALCSVYGWVILRLIVKDHSISPLMANGASMLLGGLLAFGHSFFVEDWNPLPILPENFTPFLQGTLLMTLLSNVICYNLYGMLLKRFTATFLSFMGLLSPIFASINGLIFLKEPISWTIILSTGIVSLGLWIVYRAELKQGYIPSSKVPAIEKN
jgi:drug/metabolite transporter (DMT)-like permease